MNIDRYNAKIGELTQDIVLRIHEYMMKSLENILESLMEEIKNLRATM